MAARAAYNGIIWPVFEIAAEAEAGKADALEQVESKAQIEGEAISNGDGS